MSPGAASSLNSRLEEYEQKTGHQLLVYIGQTTDGPTIDDWAVRAFQSWRVGRKGIDDGLVLFIMAADRKLRFEVGYGLEGEIPDAIASRIINEVIVPRIQSGDRDTAVTNGMNAVMEILGGGLPAERGGGASQSGDEEEQHLTWGQIILYGIIGIIALFIFATNPSLAIYLLASILSGGGGRGSGGGGGGGWSGGGGRSGGGGASGSW